MKISKLAPILIKWIHVYPNLFSWWYDLKMLPQCKTTPTKYPPGESWRSIPHEPAWPSVEQPLPLFTTAVVLTPQALNQDPCIDGMTSEWLTPSSPCTHHGPPPTYRRPTRLCTSWRNPLPARRASSTSFSSPASPSSSTVPSAGQRHTAGLTRSSGAGLKLWRRLARGYTFPLRLLTLEQGNWRESPTFWLARPHSHTSSNIWGVFGANWIYKSWWIHWQDLRITFRLALRQNTGILIYIVGNINPNYAVLRYRYVVYQYQSGFTIGRLSSCVWK